MNGQSFPKTYWDNNPEDRDYTGDFWAWLKEQPQDAWLLWARHANWDNADRVFESMLDDPGCDRAIAAWLFWKAGPAHYIRRPEAYREGCLVHKIIHNLGKGFYSRAELFLDQHEICFGALEVAGLLRSSGQASVFPVPRPLCGPFHGRKARIPEKYDAAVEAELEEIFRYRDGWLPRSEDDHWRWILKSGNLWTIDTLKLPDLPVDPQSAFATASDAEYLVAVFGKPEELETARRRARLGITLADQPGPIDALFYGGIFLGEQRQLDRAWRRFLAFSAVLAGVVLVSTRLHLPGSALVAVAALATLAPAAILSSIEMGGRRKALWLACAALLALTAAALLRWIDKGVVL